MNKKEWVLRQFNRFSKPTSPYRSAILLTSFVETSVTQSFNNKFKFKESLRRLGMKSSNNKKDELILIRGINDPNCLKNIEKIRQLRNDLLHNILIKRMPQKHIDKRIDSIRNHLKIIFSKSQIVKNYFKGRYSFDTEKELH
jgi:hypothetical protein